MTLISYVHSGDAESKGASGSCPPPPDFSDIEKRTEAEIFNLLKGKPLTGMAYKNKKKTAARKIACSFFH